MSTHMPLHKLFYFSIYFQPFYPATSSNLFSHATQLFRCILPRQPEGHRSLPKSCISTLWCIHPRILRFQKFLPNSKTLTHYQAPYAHSLIPANLWSCSSYAHVGRLFCISYSIFLHNNIYRWTSNSCKEGLKHASIMLDMVYVLLCTMLG